MILRKPYAFLIKRFKLIHLIISSMMIYLVLKTSKAVKYFNDYISSNSILRALADNYFNNLMFILIILIIIGSAVIYYLLRYKNKPKTTYLVIIIGYIACFIIFYNSFSVLKELETELLDSKTVRLWRDLLTFTLYFQYVILAIMLIRGLGFDIKKFNFQKDIKELEIKQEDNEEFEFDISSSKDKIARKTRNILRNLKYFYQEHKFTIIIIFTSIILILTSLLIINILIVNKTYKEGKTFMTNNYTMEVTSSYYTNVDAKSSYITTSDNMYLIISINVKNNNTSKKTLNLNDFRLKIKDKKYYPSNKLCNKVSDLGKCYDNNIITKDNKNYLIMYQIPKESVNKKMFLYYEDYYIITNKKVESKYKKVKLSPINLDITKYTITKSLKEEMKIDNIHINNTNLTINNYEFNTKYFHTKDNTTYPIISNNLYKSDIIIKMQVDYTSNTTLNKLINDYLTITYKIKDKEYTSNIVNKTPDEVNDYIYIEVSSNIKEADNIYLNFNIRNYKYIYILK